VEVVRVGDGTLVERMDERRGSGGRALMFSPRGRLLLAVGGTSFSTFMGGGLFTQEHLVVWDATTGALVERVPAAGATVADYEESVGAKGEEPRQLTGLAWSPLAREIAGTLYPSLLAYWTVPSGMVRGALVAWRLTDAGLVEIYRGPDGESPRVHAIAPGGGAVLVSGDDDYRRVVALTGVPLLAASCAAVRRSFTDAERRAALGRSWRAPASCPHGAP
jgi:hypothetical protein